MARIFCRVTYIAGSFSYITSHIADAASSALTLIPYSLDFLIVPNTSLTGKVRPDPASHVDRIFIWTITLVIDFTLGIVIPALDDFPFVHFPTEIAIAQYLYLSWGHDTHFTCMYRATCTIYIYVYIFMLRYSFRCSLQSSSRSTPTSAVRDGCISLTIRLICNTHCMSP